MHTKIKICGITREAEISVLNDLRIDYAGFVIFPGSKRYVTVEQAVRLKDRLAPGICSVAVTVNPSGELMRQIAEAGFDVLQIHKLDRLEQIAGVSVPVWLARQVARDEADVHNSADGNRPDAAAEQGSVQPDWNALPPPVEGILLDAAEYGSGRTFSWEEFPMEALAGRRNHRLILAGGLTEDNVQRGMGLFRPDIVDVSSSVEGRQGKDPDKIKRFVRKVREYE